MPDRKVAVLYNAAPYRLGAALLDLVAWTRTHVRWRLTCMEGRREEQALDPLKLNADGVIVSGVHVHTIRRLRRHSVPVVVVDPLPSDPSDCEEIADLPSCLVDSRAVGRFAAEELVRRRYESFAFVGDSAGMYWSEERLEGFRDRLAQSGKDCLVFRPRTGRERRDWATEMPKMSAWIKRLPKGCGVLAAMDGRARLVLEACLEAGASVPRDLGVLGVDDDPAVCETTCPRLSSIRLQEQTVMAAEMLDDILEGRRVAEVHRAVSPMSLTMRESLRYASTADPFLAAGLDFIHEHACSPEISVSAVVDAMKCSRRFAENRFSRELGMTIRGAIEEVRFVRVKELLRDSVLPISNIALKCGFSSGCRLSSRFSKLFGVTPLAWRRLNAGA